MEAKFGSCWGLTGKFGSGWILGRWEQNLGLFGYWGNWEQTLGPNSELSVANHTDARVNTDLGLLMFYVLFAEGNCSGDVAFPFAHKERGAPFQTAGIITYLSI